MSRNNAPMHKFISKHKKVLPAPVHFQPHKDLQYPSVLTNGRYEIFAQKDITIKFLAQQNIVLKFGVLISRGVALVSLRQELKLKMLSLQDCVISESVDDIVVNIVNNSASDLLIKKGDSLCFVNLLC